MLSNYVKPKFLGILKFLNSMNWFIVFFSLINLSMCIYEDQIGKFDWRQTYVGRIKFAQFDTVSTAKKIIVATEENVLAALHLKTGEVVWRHVFESTPAGNIQLLDYTDEIVTVTGTNPYYVRGWDAASGVLLWDWSLTVQDEKRAELSEWFVDQGVLVHVLPAYRSHLEVTMYSLRTGLNRGFTSKIVGNWWNDGCVLSPPYYTCVSGNLLVSTDVATAAKNSTGGKDQSALVQFIKKPLSDFVNVNGVFDGNLTPFDGNSALPGAILDDEKMIVITDNKFEVLNVRVADRSASVTIVDVANGHLVLQSWNDKAKGFMLSGHMVSSGEESRESREVVEVAEVRCEAREVRVPEPSLAAAVCSRTARDQLACRLLLSGGDDALHLLQQGGHILWTREEALANVVAAEFVDLPVSETDAAIELEFDQKEGGVVSAFARRVQSQYQQVRALLGEWRAGWQAGPAPAPPPLTRDYFNLHRVIVLVTDAGKIFGMDNLSGKLLWQHYEPNLDTESVAVFTRRTNRHPPLHAYLTIVGKHQETGNGFIISLDPIRGELVGERALRLDARLLQCALLHEPDEEKLHALIVLDEDENVQVFPRSAAPLVRNFYMYVADRDTAVVQGYALKYDGKEVSAQRTWLVRLAGGGGGTIAAVAARAPLERSRSPGRALPDRSVLYKYSNPNLVLFLVNRPDPTHKDVVEAVALDAASGAVVAGASHRRARAPAPALAIHADNCLAYLYRSDKHRRLEIATMELYEGPERWLPAGAAFSSFSDARAASVQRQAYVLPATATAAAFTITEKSLTDKHVLLGLTSGTIMEIPWALLEPRRAVSPTAAQREEGLVPYAPELPLPADAALNYNRTLPRLARLHTAPSGLESTSLVLATGLDLFYTRVAPSKTFDLLRDDFDHYLITLVLACLVVATYSTKYFASRKMLKLAWK